MLHFTLPGGAKGEVGRLAVGLQIVGRFIFDGQRYTAGDWIIWTHSARWAMKNKLLQDLAGPIRKAAH